MNYQSSDWLNCEVSVYTSFLGLHVLCPNVMQPEPRLTDTHTMYTTWSLWWQFFLWSKLDIDFLYVFSSAQKGPPFNIFNIFKQMINEMVHVHVIPWPWSCFRNVLIKISLIKKQTLQALVACPPFYNLMKKVPIYSREQRGPSSTPVLDSL